MQNITNQYLLAPSFYGLKTVYFLRQQQSRRCHILSEYCSTKTSSQRRGLLYERHQVLTSDSAATPDQC